MPQITQFIAIKDAVLKVNGVRGASIVNPNTTEVHSDTIVMGQAVPKGTVILNITGGDMVDIARELLRVVPAGLTVEIVHTPIVYALKGMQQVPAAKSPSFTRGGLMAVGAPFEFKVPGFCVGCGTIH